MVVFLLLTSHHLLHCMLVMRLHFSKCCVHRRDGESICNILQLLPDCVDLPHFLWSFRIFLMPTFSPRFLEEVERRA